MPFDISSYPLITGERTPLIGGDVSVNVEHIKELRIAFDTIAQAIGYSDLEAAIAYTIDDNGPINISLYRKVLYDLSHVDGGRFYVPKSGHTPESDPTDATVWPFKMYTIGAHFWRLPQNQFGSVIEEQIREKKFGMGDSGGMWGYQDFLKVVLPSEGPRREHKFDDLDVRIDGWVFDQIIGLEVTSNIIKPGANSCSCIWGRSLANSATKILVQVEFPEETSGEGVLAIGFNGFQNFYYAGSGSIVQPGVSGVAFNKILGSINLNMLVGGFQFPSLFYYDFTWTRDPTRFNDDEVGAGLQTVGLLTGARGWMVGGSEAILDRDLYGEDYEDNLLFLGGRTFQGFTYGMNNEQDWTQGDNFGQLTIAYYSPDFTQWQPKISIVTSSHPEHWKTDAFGPIRVREQSDGDDQLTEIVRVIDKFTTEPILVTQPVDIKFWTPNRDDPDNTDEIGWNTEFPDGARAGHVAFYTLPSDLNFLEAYGPEFWQNQVITFYEAPSSYQSFYLKEYPIWFGYHADGTFDEDDAWDVAFSIGGHIPSIEGDPDEYEHLYIWPETDLTDPHTRQVGIQTSLPRYRGGLKITSSGTVLAVSSYNRPPEGIPGPFPSFRPPGYSYGRLPNETTVLVGAGGRFGTQALSLRWWDMQWLDL